MKTLALFFAISAAAWAQDARPIVTDSRFETRPFSGDLHSQIRASTATWFGYAVRTIRGDRPQCRWRLEDGNSDIGSRTLSPAVPVHLEGSPTVDVLFRVENNRVEKIGIYSTDCPLDAGGLPFVWMTDVPAKASLAYLRTFVSTTGADRTGESAMLAISMHEDAQADDILGELARPAAAQSIREKAIFWLGANRGARGVAALKNILATDASEQIRARSFLRFRSASNRMRSTPSSAPHTTIHPRMCVPRPFFGWRRKREAAPRQPSSTPSRTTRIPR